MATYKKRDNLRLQSVISTSPVSTGLNIVYEDNKGDYIVIATIYYSQLQQECCVQSVLNGIQSYINESNFNSFADLVVEGIRLINLCNAI